MTRTATMLFAVLLLAPLPGMEARGQHSAPARALAPEAGGVGAETEIVLTGAVGREDIERAVPGWVKKTVEASIDTEAATALAAVPPGATVTVYLGTWCSDSAREVPRFWRALDQTGGMVPFTIQYMAVDRAENRPRELVEEAGLEYVPTFVVRRDGREVGRIVESSPDGIEVDLLALLTGEAEGVISGRDDLAGESAPDLDLSGSPPHSLDPLPTLQGGRGRPLP